MSGGVAGSDLPETPTRLTWWIYRCKCKYSWLRPGHVAKPRERCGLCGADVRREVDEERSR